MTESESWTHLAARVLVRPLIGTGVTPNHLTTLRLVSGLAACGALALGTPAGTLWGGVLWLVSAFLDRADGELARIGNMKSERGHLYDYWSDAVVNSAVFIGAGVGLRHGWLGPWAIPLGAVATAAMVVCWIAAQTYETLEGSGDHIWRGRFGFHIDDLLYLVAPIAWLGWLAPMLPLAAGVASVMAVITMVRLLGLRRRLSRSSAPLLEG